MIIIFIIYFFTKLIIITFKFNSFKNKVFIIKNIIFYKNYSNLERNYDTIRKAEKISFLRFEKLPVFYITDVAFCYDTVSVIFSQEEAAEYARSVLYKNLDLRSNCMEIISVEESYAVHDNVLIYEATLELVENIASIVEFEIN